MTGLHGEVISSWLFTRHCHYLINQPPAAAPLQADSGTTVHSPASSYRRLQWENEVSRHDFKLKQNWTYLLIICRFIGVQNIAGYVGGHLWNVRRSGMSQSELCWYIMCLFMFYG